MADPTGLAQQPALLRKPFDHYGRYRLAAEVVTAVGGRAVLDVGGGPGSLQAFLHDAEVIACDASAPSFWHEAAPSLVLGDGAALPFRDDAFDVVVTLDTLEHVPEERRATLLAECARVSRGWVLAVCPCATPGVADADAALLSYVRRKLGEEFDTVGVLTEHLTFGHPDPDAVEGALRAAGADVARFPSGRIDRWLPMMVLFYELMALGVDDPVERVQAWYNRLYYRDDLRAPSYRTAFLARMPGGDGPPPAEVVAALLPDGPSLAPDTGHLEAMRVGLTEGLTDVVESQRGRVAELETALARAEEQSAAAAARASEAEQRAEALEAFRRDVLNHPLMRARRLVRRAVGR